MYVCMYVCIELFLASSHILIHWKTKTTQNVKICFFGYLRFICYLLAHKLSCSD